MKKTSLLGILLGVALVPAAMAATIEGFQTPNASFGVGGEITATTTPPLLLGLPAPSGAPSFQTFCIESGIHFDANTPYSYTLTQTDHAGHALTQGTAWLFSQFSSGALAGYNYAVGPGRVTAAGNLQAAIWILQGQALPGPFVGLGAAFVAAATVATGGHEFDPSAGAFGVDVLNLNTLAGAPVQDWLAVAPDGGTTIALLGFVLVGVESLRRKFAR
jgi:hypothetical protein